MNQITQEAYDAAVATLSPGDFTAGGLPKMPPLNKALADAGFAAIKSDARDAFAAASTGPENEAEAEQPVETNTEAPDPARVMVTINESPASPLPLYVHGVGSFELQIGVPTILPREALDALHSAGGVDYTVEEIKA